jgi:hypothetical protein
MSAANSYESFVLFGNLLNIDEVGWAGIKGI